MKLFAIHAPIGPAVVQGLEGVRAARTGFSFAALAFGPLWLLARGLWLALAGYALMAAIVVGLVEFGGLRVGAAVGLFALGHLYLALEGRTLQVLARAREGRPLVDVIYARGALEAERTYLERALAAAPPADRRGSARVGDEIIGLFPEAGR